MNFAAFGYSLLFAAGRRDADNERAIIDNLIGKEKHFVISAIVSGTIFVMTLLFGFFAFKLYREFGWKIYKKIGADPRMRGECLVLLFKL
jgi:hypothetical protein